MSLVDRPGSSAGPDAPVAPDAPDAAEGADALVSRVRGHLRAPRAAGVAGLAFALLFATALVLLRASPAASGDPIDIAAAQTGEVTAAFISTFYLVPFAGVAFLWFVAVARDQVDDREDRFFATILTGSGVLFVAILFVAAGIASSVTLGQQYLGDAAPGVDQVRLVRAMCYALLFVFASRAAGVFLVCFSTVAIRTRALPTWLAVSGILLGLVLMLVVTIWEWVVLALPVWVAIVSVAILV
ncbi:MAG: hypothetical protein MUE82_10410, partial [Chloroflexi bacterium]|nr:hypothetical protein [Chloroflexota bacterium]